MRTVRIFVALAVIAMFTTGALAQEAKEKKGKRAKVNPVTQVMLRMGKLHEAMKKVDLTEEQQGKLKELHEAIGPQMKGIMKQLSEILGEEKMETAKETAKTAKEAGKNDRQVAMAVEKALTLTDEQQEKMAKVGKELTKLQRGLTKKANAILTPEQKEKLAAQMETKKKGGKKKLK